VNLQKELTPRVVELLALGVMDRRLDKLPACSRRWLPMKIP